MKKRHVRTAAAAVGLITALAACGSSSKNSGASSTTTPTGHSSSSGNTASAPGITPTTIKIGFITDLTGDGSSNYFDATNGPASAFDALNAAGGIDGRKIDLVVADTASSSAGALAAAQSLVNKGVFGIVADSSFFFGAYKYLQQAGIPVTGGVADGPEWGEQPNTNMFNYRVG